MEILIFAIIAAVLALLFAAVRVRDVLAEDEGNDLMKTIARAIQAGAATFLKREYTFLAGFVAVVASHRLQSPTSSARFSPPQPDMRAC